jgi:hypothetical protein
VVVLELVLYLCSRVRRHHELLATSTAVTFLGDILPHLINNASASFSTMFPCLSNHVSSSNSSEMPSSANFPYTQSYMSWNFTPIVSFAIKPDRFFGRDYILVSKTKVLPVARPILPKESSYVPFFKCIFFHSISSTCATVP